MGAESKQRIILDTNTLVSGFLFSGAILREAIRLAMNDYQVVFSNETWDELTDVFQRDKFERQLALGLRLRVIAELARYIELVDVKSIVTDCHDVKDNKFLSLALDAKADMIVTGDADLLALNPWRGVRIMQAADFVKTTKSNTH